MSASSRSNSTTGSVGEGIHWGELDKLGLIGGEGDSHWSPMAWESMASSSRGEADVEQELCGGGGMLLVGAEGRHSASEK